MTNFKKYIFIFLLILFAFFAGYRVGRHVTDLYLERHLEATGLRMVAIDSAFEIIAFGKMKEISKDNKGLICKFKMQVLNLSHSWDNCKVNKKCFVNIQEEFLLKTNEIINDFEKIDC